MKNQRLLALCIGLASVPQAAFSQVGSVSLEEIIVIAQRNEQNLQDVPLSILALSADAIDSRKLNDLDQLTLATPGLQLGQDNSLSMRGVGSLVFTETIDPSVALAVDEVNYGRPALGGALFNDIDRIEVLYGPQGLLFGKNASAGLINVITKKPILGEYSGRVEAEFAQRPTTPDDGTGFITKGTFNAPLTETSALRVNASYGTQEPVAAYSPASGVTGQRVDEDADQIAIRAKYLNEVSDDLTAYVIADYAEEEGIAGIFDRTIRSTGEGSFIPYALAGDGLTAGEENLEYVADGEYYRDLDSGGIQGQINYSIDSNWELVNVAAWRYYDREQQLDTDYLSIDGLNVNYNDSSYDQFSDELRLVLSGMDSLKGQLGLYYLTSTNESDGQMLGAAGVPGFPICFGPGECNYDNYNLSLLGGDSSSEMDTTSYAVFGQFDYAVTEALSLIVGGRLTRDEIDFDLIAGQNSHKYIVNLGGAPGVYEEDVGNTNFSWKLGSQYSFNDDVMGYASVSTGYKAPGFNDSPTPSGELAVDEETVTNFELGIKSMWLDQRLSANATVFHQTFDDFQVQSFDAANNTFYTQNAAEVSVDGIEMTVTAALMEGLKLSNSISILDSEFDDFPGAQCYPGQPDCGADGTFNAEGLTTPLAADFSSTTQLIYEFPVAEGMDGFVEGNWYHRSDVNFKVNQAPGAELDDIDVMGVSAGLSGDAGWSLSLFCKNCTDEVVPTFIDLDAGDASMGIASYVQAWGYNSVRTIGVNARYDF